jgi:preprotein translocase subunit SecG
LFTLLLFIHILICVALIIVVLLQSSKGEGLAGAFGGGGISGAVFGGRGAASFLSKSTSILAIVYMFSCLGLSFLSSSQRASATSTEVKSAVTEASQQDAARQQQQAAQQQAPAPSGDQSANPEDIFNQSATGKPADSGK